MASFFTDLWDYTLTSSSTPWHQSFGGRTSAGSLILPGNTSVTRTAFDTANGWYVHANLSRLSGAQGSNNGFTGFQMPGMQIGTAPVGQKYFPVIKASVFNSIGTFQLGGGTWASSIFSTSGSFIGQTLIGTNSLDVGAYFWKTGSFYAVVVKHATGTYKSGKLSWSYSGVFNSYTPMLVSAADFAFDITTDRDSYGPVIGTYGLSDAEVDEIYEPSGKYQPTSSQPPRNQPEKARTHEQVKVPSFNHLAPTSSPLSQPKPIKISGFNLYKNELKPVSSPDLKGGNTFGESLQISSQDFSPGYKNGFLSIIPEVNGYAGSLSLGTGNKVFLMSDSLSTGKTFAELPFIKQNREAKSRVALKIEPHGDFTHVLRSNDSIPLFMSHFQNRIGLNPGVGTSYYEFSPAKQTPALGGTTFGTGSYLNSASNAYTVSVFKAIEGTGYHYKSGICDSLQFSFKTGEEVLITPLMKFTNVGIVGTSTIPTTGSYSQLNHYTSDACSINFLGLNLAGFEFECSNNLKQTNPVGTNSAYYQFGKYEVKGKASIDVPRSALAYIGSMLNMGTFSVYGTLYNNEKDKIIFQMPNCVLDSFDINIEDNLGLKQIPFRAYESEDGLTPPIKLMMWTQNYSATTFQPN